MASLLDPIREKSNDVEAQAPTAPSDRVHDDSEKKRSLSLTSSVSPTGTTTDELQPTGDPSQDAPSGADDDKWRQARAESEWQVDWDGPDDPENPQVSLRDSSVWLPLFYYSPVCYV
jgi:hypothetical protein